MMITIIFIHIVIIIFIYYAFIIYSINSNAIIIIL